MQNARTERLNAQTDGVMEGAQWDDKMAQLKDWFNNLFPKSE